MPARNRLNAARCSRQPAVDRVPVATSRPDFFVVENINGTNESNKREFVQISIHAEEVSLVQRSAT